MSQPTEAMRETAPAKINLFLHVTGREDGIFHSLQSLFVFTELGDALGVKESGKLSLKLKGPFAGHLEGEEDNLVLKAALALRKEAGIKTGAELELEKNLPIASGIGGGSADAAAALRLLNRFWNTGLDEEALEAIALRLGSDVPACVQSRALYGEGRGERITQMQTMPDASVLLVNPLKAVSTGEVFSRIEPPYSVPVDMPTSFPDFHSLVDFLNQTQNDLQPHAEALVPDIEEIIGMLRKTAGCAIARMSGSGATCFGLYATPDEAALAAALLAKKLPKYWICATRLRKVGP